MDAGQDVSKFPLISHQPLRFLYWLGYKAWIWTRVPFWLVHLCLFPPPHAAWSRTTTFLTWLGREEGELFAQLGITETLSLEPEPGQDGDQATCRFEVISPAPADLYRGPLVHPDVAPAPVGMTWYPVAPQASTTPFVILHLHGGAFVWGSGRPKQLASLAATLLAETGAAAVCAPQYRLSGYGGQNPFPAALQDALTAYAHLVRVLRVPPTRIVLAGDSSGGGLAIALVRYLEAWGSPALAVPRAAVLVSPWIVPGRALPDSRAYRADPHWATDYMPWAICRWGARVYAARVPVEDPYITALGHPFRTRVPLLIALGAAEILETEGTAWQQEMQAVPGNRVDVHYEEAAPHDTLLLGPGTVWEASAREVARRIGAWLAEVETR